MTSTLPGSAKRERQEREAHALLYARRGLLPLRALLSMLPDHGEGTTNDAHANCSLGETCTGAFP